MRTLTSTRKWIATCTLLGFAAIWMATGCASRNSDDRIPEQAPRNRRSPLPPKRPRVAQNSGPKPAPAATTSVRRSITATAQWDTIVHHMRIRANLTGPEARAITKFLQASN